MQTGNGSRALNSTIISYMDSLDEWLDYVTQLQIDLYVFTSPILIILGTSGNILSLLILRSRHFSKTSCSVLLCILSVVDTGVLLTGLMRVWIMETFKYDIRTVNAATCRAHYFLTYFLQHLSSWTIVMVTIERFVSVYYPFEAKRICSQRHLMFGMMVLCLTIILLNGHVLFTLRIVEEIYIDSYDNITIYRCGFSSDYYYGNIIWPWVDYVVLAFVPFAMLLIGNTMIVVNVLGHLRNRQKSQPQMSHNSRQKGIRSLTMMMFAVTGTFFITITPYEIYLIGMGHGYWDIDSLVGTAHTMTANVICELVFYVNNSVNFLLYCFSGSRFRLALWEYFRHSLDQRYGSHNSTSRPGRRSQTTSSVVSRTSHSVKT